MSLWDLLNEPEEVKNEEAVKVETKEADVVEKEDAAKELKVEAKEKPKKETKKKSQTSKAKKSTKNQTKASDNVVQSLEEQLAATDANTKIIYDHLISIPGMKEKMENPNKSLKKMNDFIRNKAKNMAVDGCAVVEDKEVFGWAVHYYDEEIVK